MATEFEIINNGSYDNDLSADTVRGAFGKAKNNFGKVQVKAKVVALQIGYAAGIADFAEVINAKPANSLIVGPDEFPLFKGATAVGESPARQVVFFVNGAGKGAYGTGGTVTVNSADIVLVYDSAAGLTVNQNNETKYISFGKINQTDFNPLPTSEVANLFNTSISAITISETQIPWVQVTVSGPSQPSVKHIYQFLPGKGHYGSGGATVTASMFRYVNTLGATQQDVENTGNTETINLGEVTNYITALNSVGRDFTDENLQYFVKYTISGTSYFKIFIGTTYGMYGGANTLQFTDEMWQDVVTSATPTPAVTLQDVLNNGSVAIIDQATLIEYQDGTDMANVYVGDGTVDINANDAQFHMNGTGADINVPLSLLAPPTEPNHAARYGETIPLSGTVGGSPVSGDIEMIETSRGFWINGANEGDYSGIMFGEGGVAVYSITGSDNISFNVGSEDIFISSTLSNFKGATYNGDYSANFVDRSLVDKKFVIDYVADHAGGGGGGTVTSVTGVAGETTVANGTTTPVIGISSTYTAARDSYADSAAASAASGKENSANKQNSLTTDGTGVKFPTVDAVNSVLASYAKKIILDTSKSSNTGTTAEVVLKSFTISANTLATGRLKFDMLVSASGTANNRRFKIYRSTSNTFDGTAVLLSTSDLNTTNLAAQIGFDVYVRADNTFVVWPAATSKYNPYASTASAPTTGSFPVGSTNYIYVTCTNGSSADTGSVEAIAVEFLKQ